MKYSRQRELILETLRALENHPTAEELHEAVRRHMPSISLGTVYRNLNLLVDAGIIRKLESSGSASIRYDGRMDEHCHLICTSCGSIMDIDLGISARIDTAVREQAGFIVTEHGIVLKGICAECVRNHQRQ